MKHTGHVWHMALMAGIVVVAIWLGAAGSAALLFAALTCAVMLAVLAWFVVSSTRTVSARRIDEPDRREPFASPEPDRR